VALDFSGFLQHYGYAAVFVGTVVEGETLLLLGAFAAHRGYLHLPWVIATAFVGSVISDQMYFHLSRWRGPELRTRHPQLSEKLDSAVRLVQRHGTMTVLAMRFMWGLRIALPLAMGLTGMSARRFLMLDLVSAAAWSCAFGLIGYGATELLHRWVGHLHRYEHWIIATLLCVAIAILAWRWWPRGSRLTAAHP
jgi:membrane protein DedA with SNARE-associated domain